MWKTEQKMGFRKTRTPIQEGEKDEPTQKIVENLLRIRSVAFHVDLDRARPGRCRLGQADGENSFVK